MSLKTRWINLLYNSATGSRKIRNLLSPLGGLFYASLIALFIVVSLGLDRALKLPMLLPKPFNLILSLPLFVLVVFMIGWSVLHFLKVKGTPVPFSPPPELVKTGPYAYVRNPMLAGVFVFTPAAALPDYPVRRRDALVNRVYADKAGQIADTVIRAGKQFLIPDQQGVRSRSGLPAVQVFSPAATVSPAADCVYQTWPLILLPPDGFQAGERGIPAVPE